jgi:pyruvate-ferredoxin/flavodoxin oxidoreductase
MPYFEFSGACAGCGETPYIKLVSQLYGDRMIIANATGCSSIYSGTFPTTPYTKDRNGKGPAWANSLFEDNAEYGLGMRLAVTQNRKLLKHNVEAALAAGVTGEVAERLKFALDNWKATDASAKANADALKKLLPAAVAKASGAAKDPMARILELQDFFIEKSVWAIGGDGWAYDIGYGGLDHVIASGENINILVVDTEVYSNTGGQASKSTPIGAIAKFAEAGKEISKKDLALIAMSYGYVYVATCAFGANMAQTLRAIREAESYEGPSLVICYSTCIAHGTNMSTPTENMKRAVEAGHFPLFRYDPRLALEGKNPLQMDSKETKIGYTEYLLQETRYKSLQKASPDKADTLYKKAEESDKRRLAYLKKLAELQY